jgi:hypothetical protein
LAKEHPETLRALQKIVDNLPVYAYRMYVTQLDFPNLTVEMIVRGLKK